MGTVVGVVEHVSGGILGALSILKDHWGAVGRDLTACHYTWDEACALPFDQFVQFIVYAPPGTAIFHVVNEGWTADTHQLTSLIDIGNVLLWSKSQDAREKQPQHRPQQIPRPGSNHVVQEHVPEMTVDQYLRLAGGET